MKQTIGYTRFSMSYNDMLIVNMAIMDNINIKGNKIDIAGKPVYEIYPEADKVKEDILQLVRLAYAKETFYVIDRIWSMMNMERSMINYPMFYWISQVSMIKSSILCREIKERIDSLEEAEQSLCLKSLISNRMEKVLALWNAALRSLGISYKNVMMTHEELFLLRKWKVDATRLNYTRIQVELQLAMCGVIHFNLHNAPFREIVKMIEE